MPSITIRLLKPGKGIEITYEADLLIDEPGHRLAHAHWQRPTLDLGYVVFERGDDFYEHFYSEHWFNIFEIRSPKGLLKGWYCNITRPAQFAQDSILSEDLELDLFVAPDRQQILTLDEQEFAARKLADSDPVAHDAALAALGLLTQMARTGAPPFDGIDGYEGTEGAGERNL